MPRKITALNLTSEAVAKGAANERARKKASKKALAEAKQANEAIMAEEDKRYTVEAELPKTGHAAEDRANALATAKADAEATGVTLEAMLLEMGIRADGSPIPTKLGYFGPMLALRAASEHYVRGIHNGDSLASLLDHPKLDREKVCTLLIKAMKLEGNPYRHLNPGQQSMNLRNKARGQVKNGFLTLDTVKAAIEDVLA